MNDHLLLRLNFLGALPRPKCGRNQYAQWQLVFFSLFILLLPSSPTRAEILSRDLIKPILYTVSIEQRLPHSQDAFTQGLVLYKNSMIESSGLYGRSFIQRFHLQTNQPENKRQLHRSIFAEGIAINNDRLYLLTWKRGKALIYDPESLELLDHVNYEGEGWGLASFNSQLIMSNGSATLTYRSPKTFARLNSIDVTLNQQPLFFLNALASTDAQSPYGELIWANVWRDNRIFAIHPQSGNVMGIADLSALAADNPSRTSDDVLNGIAWDAENQGFWVTGKRWKTRYLIRLTQDINRTP